MSDASITQICTTMGIIVLAYIGYLKLKLEQQKISGQLDTHVEAQKVQNTSTAKQLDVIEKQGNGALVQVGELNRKLGHDEGAAQQRSEDAAINKSNVTPS